MKKDQDVEESIEFSHFEGDYYEWLEELSALHREMGRSAKKVIRQYPQEWADGLERLGFIWVEDELPESLGSQPMIPENGNQEYLMAYFEGHFGLDERVVNTYCEEVHTDRVNVSFIAKYFKLAHPKLKQLILLGLAQSPTDRDFLLDLALFHEYQQILGELIEYYQTACLQEQDLRKFEWLARDFEMMTEPDGFQALDALYDLLGKQPAKQHIIESLMSELQEGEQETPAFPMMLS